MTLTEKLLARASGKSKVQSGDNIWVNADPVEKMLPAVVRFAGDDKFFVGSDYPHAEGFVDPVRQTREGLSSLPPESVEKILSLNARKFFRIP